ncbi:YbhB/YbcL family Raf kinase inhibitor-like protein [Anseongella ginsenosidimutans]|uniref:YbhB/YbcL family Raf kinase inhibitor-like protein n=1 Tax=Anseongella ginsenosidimutans TaxID=496056 RepID=UPI003D7BD6AB
MQILSVFKEGEAIPTAHTCLGPNISPPLELKDIPAGTQSLVLIVEDIDAAPKPGLTGSYSISPGNRPCERRKDSIRRDRRTFQ